MMCAIGMGLGWFESPPTTAGSHVPLHASSADAGFFYRTRPLICSAPRNASLNLAPFDVDTLAQAVMRAVRDGDAAALQGYSTRRCRTCGAIRSSAPG